MKDINAILKRHCVNSSVRIAVIIHDDFNHARIAESYKWDGVDCLPTLLGDRYAKPYLPTHVSRKVE